MSREDAIAFIKRVGQSAALREEVERYSGRGVLERLTALGAEHGFEFTAEEYRAAVVELADGALSEASLDEVLRESGLK